MNRRRAALAVLLIAALLLVWLWPTASTRSNVVRVVAAGGMACASSDPRYAEGKGVDGWCQQRAVSDVVMREPLDAVFGLGDYQYEEARASDYEQVYGPSWGRVRAVTRPAIGNQEYKVHDANTFTDYFGSNAPDASKGWYSYDLGAWHVVVLNSNCELIGGCDGDSEQVRWLMNDLQHDHHRCTVAYWHHPRWSTGLYGGDGRVDQFWRTLALFRVDVAIAAHEHDYERFEPIGVDGRPSPTGITSFVAGASGQAVYGPDDTVGGGTGAAERRAQQAASEIRIDRTMGALFLTLGETSFEWRYVGLDGTVLDQGSRECVQ